MRDAIDFDVPEWVSEPGGPTSAAAVAVDVLPSAHGAPVREEEPPRLLPLTRAERRELQAGGRHHRQAERRSAGGRHRPGRHAASVPASRGRHRPQRPSRRVRLHRTVLGAAVLAVLLVTATTMWVRGDSPPSTTAAGRVTVQAGAAAAAAGALPSAAEPDLGPADNGPTLAAAAAVTARVVEQGSGRLSFVPLPPIADLAPAGARTWRVSLEVEDGTELDTQQAARLISKVLGDQRGWQRADRVRFVAVSRSALSAGQVDLRITLASPRTTDRLCYPLQTEGDVSCYNNGRSVLNTKRWLTGVRFYADDLAGYRTYMVNHEVGHGLGHGHATCPQAGARAPVMLQQTLHLNGCTRWPWPT